MRPLQKGRGLLQKIQKCQGVINKQILKDYPEAQEALNRINAEIDKDYALDGSGIVCLFETGYRQPKETKLEFEKFLTNLSNIQKSTIYQPSQAKNQTLEQHIKAVKSHNSLNAAEYKKQYIVNYGYKYVEGGKDNGIYTLGKNYKPGKDIGIKLY